MVKVSEAQVAALVMVVTIVALAAPITLAKAQAWKVTANKDNIIGKFSPKSRALFSDF